MHFTVMVIGNNPEELLENYSEHLEVPAYKVEVSSKWDMEYIEKAKKECGNNAVLFNEKLKEMDDIIAAFDENGVERYYRETTFNPNGRWDWYMLGGRWSGEVLILKKDIVITEEQKESLTGEAGVFGNETGIDASPIFSLDFEAMTNKQLEVPLGIHDELMKVLGPDFVFDDIDHSNTTLPSKLNDDYVGTKYEPLTKLEDNGETVYQNIVKKYGYGFHKVSYVFGKFLKPREELVKEVTGKGYTYAILDETGWYDKDSPGYIKKINQVRTLGYPEETFVSIYDCHC